MSLLKSVWIGAGAMDSFDWEGYGEDGGASEWAVYGAGEPVPEY